MKTQTYTQEQHTLIAQLSATYGLDPSQISFFDTDPEPFFDRDATAVLIHRLTDAVGIEDDLAMAPTIDTLAVKYKITFADGSFASSTGMANLAETVDGQPMSIDQVKSLATSRAARSALRNRGINLMRLHESRGQAGTQIEYVQFAAEPRSQFESLLREAHALGSEVGLIQTDANKQPDKRAWYTVLGMRYNVGQANHLQLGELADFVAFLRTLRRTSQQSHAAA